MRSLLLLGLLLPLGLAAAPAPKPKAPVVVKDEGLRVRVVLQDDRVIKGELVGIDKGAVTLVKKGQALEFQADQIKKVFDSQGRRLSLAPQWYGGSPEALYAQEKPEPVKVVHLPSDRAANVGTVLAWVGPAVLVGGLITYFNGSHEMELAMTGGYLRQPAGEAVNSIDGHYVTTAARDRYYDGMAVRNVGNVVSYTGLGLCLTAAILTWTHSETATQMSVSSLEDGQLKFAIPLIQVQPQTLALQASLLEAKF